MKLAGKTALVTGSARGIGLGCAMRLAEAGATVIINDRPGGSEIESALEQLKRTGAECFAIEADVFSRAGCEQLLADSMKHVEAIDILISNPAMNDRGGFLDQDPDVFDRLIHATLSGGFHMSQLVARQMVRRGQGGKIVFTSSVQAELPIAGSVAYNAAKAGLNHLARSIAVELAEHKINVNVIEPGWIETPGEYRYFSKETLQQEAAGLPLKRLGRPEDIGNAAAFLCSSEADYITGATLVVDGGFRDRPWRITPVKTAP